MHNLLFSGPCDLVYMLDISFSVIIPHDIRIIVIAGLVRLQTTQR